MYTKAEEMLSGGDTSKPLILHRSLRSSYYLILFFLGLTVSVVNILVNAPEINFPLRILGIIPMIPLLELVRRYYNDVYIITRDRVTHYQGRISLKYSVPTIRCIDLRAISVSQGLVGRIFNFGTVYLSTAAQDGTELEIAGVLSPQELSRLIDDLRQSSNRAIIANSGGDPKVAQIGQGE